ncbi:MAG: protein TolR [Alphaproteobacteria bacterium]|nr:protein TolR [Alphaproteobacteria bacterium]
MAEINVTPFVDVMLVLLIVFMITAPMLIVGVPVDLPETRASPVESRQELIVVTINDTGSVFLRGKKVDFDGLAPKLSALADNDRETRIYVRGDKAVNYGRIMDVMEVIGAAGFHRIVLITEPKAGG